MTATTVEETPADLTDDALYAQDPDDPGVPEEPEFPDLSPDADAPYGYTVDKQTGERRAKRAPGRPRTVEQLTAGQPVEAGQDKPPGRRAGKTAPVPDDEVPMPKGGVIAKGMDRAYRRAGKIVRVWHFEMGTAFIECTRKDPDDPDSPTVGEAWENLARNNPRVRAWALRIIAGGDWQELIFAHAPIGIALVTSTWVGRLIPFGRLAESMLEPDEDSTPEDLRPEDAQEMMATAQANAQKIAAKMGVKVPANVAEAAMREAQAHAQRMGVLTPPYVGHDLPPDEASGNGSAPPAFRRQQPKATSRAQRRH